jgi:lipid-A-disaccharide synthase
MIKIFIIAGEESGDQLGAALMKALKEKIPQIEFRGVGGAAMKQAGLGESLFPMQDLSLMGLVEVVPKIPKMLNRIIQTVTSIKVFNPDIVLTIDSPDFCFRVQKEIKKSKLKARQIHFVAPTVWAWRPERAKKIAAFLNGLICLFPFETKYFEEQGLHAVAVGHPVLKSGVLEADGSVFRRIHGFNEDQKILGLFLGSRKSEMDRLSKTIIETAKVLSTKIPGLGFIVPTLPRWREHIKNLLAQENIEAVVTSDPDEKWNAFKACDAALAVSGTVALEITVADIPHAILYRMNPITWKIVQHMVTTRHAHLANIMLDQALVPEFLQDEASVDRIAPALEKLLTDPLEQAAQKQGFQKVRDILQPDPSTSAAEQVAAFVQTFL